MEKAFQLLKDLPYEDIGFASIDHHRFLRQGFPEVIFCLGKEVSEITHIAQNLLKTGSDILATRADQKIYKAIKKIDRRTEYNQTAKTITIRHNLTEGSGNILIITAGTSDRGVAEEAKVTAEIMGSRVETIFDVGVAGIHRIFSKREKIMEANVLIVVAGMDGALPSVIGGLAKNPVIAVPTSSGYGASFGGLSALLTMLNSCASGIGVVNIDNGFGAGCLAHKINILGKTK